MTLSLPFRVISGVLALLIGAPNDFAQTPPVARPAGAASSNIGSGPLTVGILEGGKAVNSLPLLRGATPVVEVRDRNDFPVEGATVVFTLPADGPGGTFAIGGAASFTARTDSHGQASAPAIVPRGVGRFDINVSAALGDRKGAALISETNSAAAVLPGAEVPSHHWYRRKLVLAAAGGAVVLVTVLLLTRKSSTAAPTTITITPGPPVFH